MNSKRPGAIKSATKAASGGVIVVVALLALMFFRGSGTGTGDGEMPDSQPMASTELPQSQAASTTIESAEPNSKPEAGGLTPDEQRALSGDVLSVLIDERDYLIELPGADGPVFRPAKLSRLLELATQVKGDTNGIRVRVVRRENARASAENQIKQELSKIGIGDDAIYMPADFIP